MLWWMLKPVKDFCCTSNWRVLSFPEIVVILVLNWHMLFIHDYVLRIQAFHSWLCRTCLFIFVRQISHLTAVWSIMCYHHQEFTLNTLDKSLIISWTLQVIWSYLFVRNKNNLFISEWPFIESIGFSLTLYKSIIYESLK